jgi:DNA-binding NarL/FixJ family response regulator
MADAALEERARIAREMHDIVAHSLAVIVRLAEGGAFVAGKSPDQAGRSLRTIAHTGRGALADMRGLLGVLRDPRADADGANGATFGGALNAPQPTLADLTRLVASVRDTGIDAELTESGEAFALSVATELAVYRLAQEGLTNAVGPRRGRTHLGAHRADRPGRRRRPRFGRAGPGFGDRAAGAARSDRRCGRDVQRRPARAGVPRPGSLRPAGSGNPPVTIRVALVDDQELIRTGLAMVIDACDDLAVVVQASDGAEAFERLATTAVDVVLMDVQMPRVNGVDATALITARAGAPKVIVLTTFDLDEYAYAALRAGASGFLLKDAAAADVLAAIRAVHSGDAVIAPSTTRRMLEHLAAAEPRASSDDEALSVLTDREREVLVEIANGHANAEIARRLYLSQATVKTHVGRILAKLGLRDRVHAVIFAYDHGLVRPP